MQLLGILILPGILVLLLVAAVYLANTQKTPNRRTGSALDDLYRSKGMGNVLDARDALDSFSSGARPRQQRRQGKEQNASRFTLVKCML